MRVSTPEIRGVDRRRWEPAPRPYGPGTVEVRDIPRVGRSDTRMPNRAPLRPAAALMGLSRAPVLEQGIAGLRRRREQRLGQHQIDGEGAITDRIEEDDHGVALVAHDHPRSPNPVIDPALEG